MGASLWPQISNFSIQSTQLVKSSLPSCCILRGLTTGKEEMNKEILKNRVFNEAATNPIRIICLRPQKWQVSLTSPSKKSILSECKQGQYEEAEERFQNKTKRWASCEGLQWRRRNAPFKSNWSNFEGIKLKQLFPSSSKSSLVSSRRHKKNTLHVMMDADHTQGGRKSTRFRLSAVDWWSNNNNNGTVRWSFDSTRLIF